MKRPFSAARSSHPVLSARKPAEVQPVERPAWDSTVGENPHKLSRAEQLQRKLNARSKHEAAARAEVQARLAQLKSGAVPAEYRPFTAKAPRKITANEAFIKNPQLQREYQNRSYATVQKQKERVEEQIRFTQEAPVSVTCPPRQPLREQVPSAREEEYRPPQLESLLAMIQETKKELHEEKPPVTITTQPEEYVRPDFDYLDYQENEARLERLRSENMQFYSNFTLPPP